MLGLICIVCILGACLIIILAIAAAIRCSSKPFFDDPVDPECMTCDQESCIGCPIIESKVGKIR